MVKSGGSHAQRKRARLSSGLNRAVATRVRTATDQPLPEGSEQLWRPPPMPSPRDIVGRFLKDGRPARPAAAAGAVGTAGTAGAAGAAGDSSKRHAGLQAEAGSATAFPSWKQMRRAADRRGADHRGGDLAGLRDIDDDHGRVSGGNGSGSGSGSGGSKADVSAPGVQYWSQTTGGGGGAGGGSGREGRGDDDEQRVRQVSLKRPRVWDSFLYEVPRTPMFSLEQEKLLGASRGTKGGMEARSVLQQQAHAATAAASAAAATRAAPAAQAPDGAAAAGADDSSRLRQICSVLLTQKLPARARRDHTKATTTEDLAVAVATAALGATQRPQGAWPDEALRAHASRAVAFAVGQLFGVQDLLGYDSDGESEISTAMDAEGYQ